MRIIFFILILAHGMIHLLGFVKAFEIKTIQELTLPISRPMGLLWLLASSLLVTYSFLYIFQFKYDWVVGALAVAISLFLVIWFWKDAKYGIIANLAIILVLLTSVGNFLFGQLIGKERHQIIFPTDQVHSSVFSEAEISGLPVPVQKWLTNSGALGKEKTYLGRIRQKAFMKLMPDQSTWYQAQALQYSTLDPPAFIWTVEMKMNPFLKLQGRDKLVEGKGEMLIKMNNLVNIVYEKGPKLDEGSLQRFLGEMVWFPSMAISPYITWEHIDKNAAKATLTYGGTSGSGKFYFDGEGNFVKFTAIRFKDNNLDSKPYEWILTVDDYQVFDGIKVPSKMKATWKLEEGDWTWLHLEIKDIQYNEKAL